MNTPTGWKETTLGDIFDSKEQVNELLRIYHTTKGDSRLMEPQLLSWFTKPDMAKQLEAKGLDPVYASYAIPFWLNKGAQDAKGR